MRARHVLANVAPWVLRILLGDSEARDRKPAGSQLKIDFLLSRLPKLKSGHDPEEAFAGTFHVAEEYSALEKVLPRSLRRLDPGRPPGEFYCHSLTDPSILGDLAGQGVHTLTYFGLHMPEALFATDRAGQRDEAVRRAIAAVDVHLAEPLMDWSSPGPTASRASRPRCPRTSRTISPCPAATSSTATSSGRGQGAARRSTPPPSSGAWPPIPTPSCCAVRAPVAAAR